MTGRWQRLGRTHREAGKFPLSIGQAHTGMAKAEDRPRTGVRHRRLDRAASYAIVFRCAAPWRLRKGLCALSGSAFVGLRGSHGDGIRRARAGAAHEAVEATRKSRNVRRRAAQDEPAASLGTPTLVAQIKFTEWTADHKLRHPVYLGLRDDKKPEEIGARTGREASRSDVRPPDRLSQGSGSESGGIPPPKAREQSG